MNEYVGNITKGSYPDLNPLSTTDINSYVVLATLDTYTNG